MMIVLGLKPTFGNIPGLLFQSEKFFVSCLWVELFEFVNWMVLDPGDSALLGF
jgi:hypothetical protein